MVGETLKALLAQAQSLSDLGNDVSEEKGKERSAYDFDLEIDGICFALTRDGRWRDTVTVFLQSLFRNFSGAAHPHFADCVAILLYCQNDVDPEVSKTAKAGLALAAQVTASPQEVRVGFIIFLIAAVA